MLKGVNFNLFVFIFVTIVSCRLFYSNFYLVVLFSFILFIYFVLLFYFVFLRVGFKAHLSPRSKFFGPNSSPFLAHFAGCRPSQSKPQRKAELVAHSPHFAGPNSSITAGKPKVQAQPRQAPIRPGNAKLA